MTAEPDSRQTVRFATALEGGLACFTGPVSVLGDGQKTIANRKRPLLTAFSGGPDSTALVLLAEQYARQRGISHQVVLIDHGLRNDSADEASRVATRMRYFGIDIEIRRVEAIVPKGGIQNWARLQRYEILTSIARKTGAVLLLAHHKADQAETVFMRLSHGSGLGGLGGMEPICCFADVPVLRPLLKWRQDELMAVCRNFGCGYENDPSNQDRRFERVRVRHSLACFSRSGKDMAAGLIRLSAAAQAICCSVDAILEEQLELPELFAEGYAVFSLAALRPLPDSLWRRVVGRFVLAVGGGDYLRSQVAFSRLRSRLEAGVSATLGGCRFTLMGGGVFCRILHELGRSPPHVKIVRPYLSFLRVFGGLSRRWPGIFECLVMHCHPRSGVGSPMPLGGPFQSLKPLTARCCIPTLHPASVKSARATRPQRFWRWKNRRILVKKKSGHSVALNAGLPVVSKKGRSCRE